MMKLSIDNQPFCVTKLSIVDSLKAKNLSYKIAKHFISIGLFDPSIYDISYNCAIAFYSLKLDNAPAFLSFNDMINTLSLFDIANICDIASSLSSPNQTKENINSNPNFNEDEFFLLSNLSSSPNYNPSPVK